jgi:hypothetical protein
MIDPRLPYRGYRNVTRGSLDSQTLLQPPRPAPPVGRALRILLGLVLMAYMVAVYFQVPRVSSCRGLAADARVDWRLQPNPHRCIATNRPLWPVPRGPRGRGVARRAVCCRCLGSTGAFDPPQGRLRVGLTVVALALIVPSSVLLMFR